MGPAVVAVSGTGAYVYVVASRKMLVKPGKRSLWRALVLQQTAGTGG